MQNFTVKLKYFNGNGYTWKTGSIFSKIHNLINKKPLYLRPLKTEGYS